MTPKDRPNCRYDVLQALNFDAPWSLCSMRRFWRCPNPGLLVIWSDSKAIQVQIHISGKTCRESSVKEFHEHHESRRDAHLRRANVRPSLNCAASRRQSAGWASWMRFSGNATRNCRTGNRHAPCVVLESSRPGERAEESATLTALLDARKQSGSKQEVAW